VALGAGPVSSPEGNPRGGEQVDGLAELLRTAEVFAALAAIGLALRLAALLGGWGLRARSGQSGRSLAGLAVAVAVGGTAAAAFTALLRQPWAA
jgi:hypothetical protein